MARVPAPRPGQIKIDLSVAILMFGATQLTGTLGTRLLAPAFPQANVRPFQVGTSRLLSPGRRPPAGLDRRRAGAMDRAGAVALHPDEPEVVGPAARASTHPKVHGRT